MKIITELCQNHNGDINIVKDMVEQSKLGGADICKIQSIKADSLTNRSEYETFRTYQSEYDRFKELELSYRYEVLII